MGETKRTLKVRLSEYRQAVNEETLRTVLQFMFKRPTTASTGKSKEEPKGSGRGEL